MTEKAPLLVACPRCGTRSPWKGNPFRPFCSEKCRLVDLGRWAGEDYRIAGEEVDPENMADVIEFPKKSDD